jgi:hypothetical protein
MSTIGFRWLEKDPAVNNNYKKELKMNTKIHHTGIV